MLNLLTSSSIKRASQTLGRHSTQAQSETLKDSGDSKELPRSYQQGPHHPKMNTPIIKALIVFVTFTVFATAQRKLNNTSKSFKNNCLEIDFYSCF